MRFFYYYPTMRKPVGGVKQIRLTAMLLTELGVPTFLLRDQSFFAPGGGFDDDCFYGVPVPQAPFAFQDAVRTSDRRTCWFCRRCSWRRRFPFAGSGNAGSR